MYLLDGNDFLDYFLPLVDMHGPPVSRFPPVYNTTTTTYAIHRRSITRSEAWRGGGMLGSH
jgi:hypothetical protein